MTARFLALYAAPADPEAFDRPYREVHIPLGRRLPGLRRCTVGRRTAPVRAVLPGRDAAPVRSMIITLEEDVL